MQKVFDKLRELQKILLNEFESEAVLEEIPRELNELKKRFHKLGLNGCIRALAEVVRSDLTLVDGIVGLEGDGPWRWDTPKEVNLLVAGQDVV